MIANTISEVLSKVKDKLNSVEAHLLLSDVYANAVGIFNLNERADRPLHSVAMHDAEETGLNSAFFDAIKLYRDNRVYQFFGLSWNEMKKLTHEEFTYIMELSAESAKNEHNKTQESLKGMQNSMKK